MLADLAPRDRDVVGLATVVAGAPALTRVDRKYLVAEDVARRLLSDLHDSWAVLVIDGRRTSSYASTYFDSEDLRTARDHVQRRRRRWKARSRLYVEDGLCRIEVKAKDGRGQTVKTVGNSSAETYGSLSLPDRHFIVRSLAQHAIAVDGASLRPTVEVSYERMTLARTAAEPARLTLDWGMRSRFAGRRVSLDREHVLVETKGGLRATDADRLLASLGARPLSFSKYVATASLLHTDIPDNDVRRLRGRLLHVEADDLTHQIRSHTA